DALPERTGRWHVDNLDSRTGPHVHVDPIQARILVHTSGADRPYLTGGQRVRADGVLAVELGRCDEPLHPLFAHRVTEMRVAELCAPDSLLLFFDPPPALHCEAHRPLEVLVRDERIPIRMEQLEQAVDRSV